MNHTFRILEVSIRHATEQGTFAAAMHLTEQWVQDGFNTLFVLPWMQINRSLSGSPYAVIDHLHVDDALGNFEDAVRWVDCCHERGLAVILDMPLNHTSPAHRWTAISNWFVRDSAGGALSPVGTNWKDVIQLNHAEPEVIHAGADVLKYWMRVGVDGFRLDAASFIPDVVIQHWIEEINASSGRPLHWWCDGAQYAAERPFFTGYFHHEAFQLALGNYSAWIELVNAPANGGIFYLTNHDTLHAGVSPAEQWPGRYEQMRALMESTHHHSMLSLSDYNDTHSTYSFIR
jgi:glycosidase